MGVIKLLFVVLLVLVVGAFMKSYFEVREKEEAHKRAIHEAEIRWARAEENHKARVEHGLEAPMNCDGCGKWLGPDLSLEESCCPGCGYQYHPACMEKHWQESEFCWKKHTEQRPGS
jgi:hypothetical protein